MKYFINSYIFLTGAAVVTGLLIWKFAFSEIGQTLTSMFQALLDS